MGKLGGEKGMEKDGEVMQEWGWNSTCWGELPGATATVQ